MSTLDCLGAGLFDWASRRASGRSGPRDRILQRERQGKKS